MNTTRWLAQRIVGFSSDDIDAATGDRALLATLDTLAAAIGGMPTANASSTRRAALTLFGPGDHPVWFSGARSTLGGALLANCAAASALDIDDGHRGAAGHPGASIVPAVLCRAHRERWNGRRLLASIVVGYEVALRIASARLMGPDVSYAAGRWCGYGVAAALGWLKGLSVDQMMHALAIAGAESPQSLPQGASGDMGTVKGSSPWATFAGLAAVERAREGSTGPVDILDLGIAWDPKRIETGWGERWEINATYLKPYASCRYTHPAIDAVVALAAGESAGGAAIDGITVEIFPEASKIPNESRPRSLEGAQFSLPFCVAVAALRGADALRPLREASLADEAVLALSERVALVFSDEFAGRFPACTPARVTIDRAGRRRSHQVDFPLGDTGNPMSRADVEAKLGALSRGTLAEHVPAMLVGACDALLLDDADPLLHVLSGDGSVTAVG